MNKIQYEKANKRIGQLVLIKDKSQKQIEEAIDLVYKVEAYEKEHHKRKKKKVSKIL